MKTEQSIAIMKALADQSRLGIVNSLLERSQYVEEIAKRHGLAASTVSFHLRKLEQAGLVSCRKEQYYTMVTPNEEIFGTTLREIVSAQTPEKGLQEDRIKEYRRKVIESFFRNGRLDKLPAQQKKRLIVLDQFAARFEIGRRYDEQEVTALIVPLYDDYCMIRRLLVEEGLIRREGASYWREAEIGAAVPLPTPLSTEKGAGKEMEKNQRSEIKRQYKLSRPDMGIYQIRNTSSGRIYVGSTTNLDATRTSRMFQLRMGKVVFSPQLQADLNQFGAPNFEFSILEVLDRSIPEEKSGRALAQLHLKWLEKLQPFGARGYNSAKAFEREKASALIQ